MQAERQVLLFNPTWADRTEPAALHQPLLERLLEELHLGSSDGQMSHHLILGPPGSGKTTLLHRIKLGLKEPGLASAWTPLLLSPDLYDIVDLESLWRRCLSELRGEPPKVAPEEGAAPALTKLLGEARARGRYLVLLVDNVTRLFERLVDELGALRRALSEDGLILIGADSQIPSGTTRYDEPFFDFFSVHELSDLDRGEALGLVKQLAGSQVFATGALKRLEALLPLGGGNARFVVAWYLVAQREPENSALADLLGVLDLFTPAFEAIFEQCSEQQQSILYSLCQHWHPIGSAALASRLKLKSTTVSGQLERMVQRGFVEKVPLANETGLLKKQGFQARNRSLNLWCLARSGLCGRRRISWLLKAIHVDEEEQIARLIQDAPEQWAAAFRAALLERNVKTQDILYAVSPEYRRFLSRALDISTPLLKP